ncbi:fibroblast growth factor 5-like [Watersipora subatra]|uniref:fibroblast growth factor 5-like n=1 Tax=Watersipora subatra TaxID=2589382 RepID=UPI00355B1942
MTSNLLTEQEYIEESRSFQKIFNKHCVEALVQHSPTLKWCTDTPMATAVALGAAPTLTSLVGVPALADAIATSPKGSILQLSKRSNSQTKYLNSMTGYTLHIWPNGTVSGLKSHNTSAKKYAMLEFVTTILTLSSILKMSDSSNSGQEAKVEIKGVESNLWLCMDKRGALYGGKRKTEECEFYEDYEHSEDWSTYYSVQHPENKHKIDKWYIALNRRGRPKVAMSFKHRSSRFKTSATQSRTDAPELPSGIEIGKPHIRDKPYTRARGNKPNKPLKDPRDSEEKPKERNNISIILSSIENAIKEAPVSKNSNPESFHDSMLIDLGENNPFLNIDTGDRIRHANKKVKPRRRKGKKMYRRKNKEHSR